MILLVLYSPKRGMVPESYQAGVIYYHNQLITHKSKP